ncbi:MAG TPA: hypothetical protein DEF18_08595 [Muricauda sp.]|nr:hypothetical protein [Allomuricauda sp.]HBU78146.1 hypothetical protein [Allomuricauda sp.]|tara:strand:- start:9006 stop:9185 length:180 start_codon:yes stop_codon:yes gene_type:complete
MIKMTINGSVAAMILKSMFFFNFNGYYLFKIKKFKQITINNVDSFQNSYYNLTQSIAFC